MKNWQEGMNNLSHMIVEMIKDTKRMLEITLEMIRAEEFSKMLFDEAMTIEEEINQYQIKIDEKCVELIARFQPTAIDLRSIVGIMKMNTDLERIGDHCINISKTMQKAFNDKGEMNKEMVSILKMGEKVYKMYEIFYNGYLNHKVENGYIILGLDDEIDSMKEEHISKIKEQITSNVECLELGIENLLISRNYERIADQITNLGEVLVFIHKGEDVRHKRHVTTSDRKGNNNENSDS